MQPGEEKGPFPASANAITPFCFIVPNHSLKVYQEDNALCGWSDAAVGTHAVIRPTFPPSSLPSRAIQIPKMVRKEGVGGKAREGEGAKWNGKLATREPRRRHERRKTERRRESCPSPSLPFEKKAAWNRMGTRVLLGTRRWNMESRRRNE